MMAELAIAKQGTVDYEANSDVMIRAEAFATVTAELLTVIFTDSEDDVKDIVEFMNIAAVKERSDIKEQMDAMVDLMSNPN